MRYPLEYYPNTSITPATVENEEVIPIHLTGPGTGTSASTTQHPPRSIHIHPIRLNSTTLQAIPRPSISGLAFAICAASLPLLRRQDVTDAAHIAYTLSTVIPYLWEPTGYIQHDTNSTKPSYNKHTTTTTTNDENTNTNNSNNNPNTNTTSNILNVYATEDIMRPGQLLPTALKNPKINDPESVSADRAKIDEINALNVNRMQHLFNRIEQVCYIYVYMHNVYLYTYYVYSLNIHYEYLLYIYSCW